MSRFHVEDSGESNFDKPIPFRLANPLTQYSESGVELSPRACARMQKISLQFSARVSKAAQTLVHESVKEFIRILATEETPPPPWLCELVRKAEKKGGKR